MEGCQSGNGTDLKSDVTYSFVGRVRLLHPPLINLKRYEFTNYFVNIASYKKFIWRWYNL